MKFGLIAQAVSESIFEHCGIIYFPGAGVRRPAPGVNCFSSEKKIFSPFANFL